MENPNDRAPEREDGECLAYLSVLCYAIAGKCGSLLKGKVAAATARNLDGFKRLC